MKVFLKIFLFLLLSVAIALSVASCGSTQEVSFGGLSIEIPKEFEAKNVEFTQCCYTSDKVMLMIDVFLTEDIYDQLGYDSKITLTEYMEEFCRLNGQKDITYDEERGRAHYTEHNPDGDRYYSYYFFRTDRALYFLSFNCLIEYESEFVELFDTWADTIEVK